MKCSLCAIQYDGMKNTLLSTCMYIFWSEPQNEVKNKFQISRAEKTKNLFGAPETRKDF